MDLKILLDIKDEINKLSESNGVRCIVFDDNADFSRIRTADIELRYDNYIYSERFNSSMSIEKADVTNVALDLLRALFSDYFNAKSQIK